MKEDFKTYCDSCKSDSLQRYITSVPKVHFKGEGWTSKELRLSSMSRA